MPQAGTDDRPTILISGMFDMHNFGDLMFPPIAAHELGRRGLRVRAMSPTGCGTGLRDAVPSIPIASAYDAATRCDGILIGGGYIIHTHRMDMLREYRSDGIGAAVGPAMWLGATLVAALRDVPVAWNAPGVPHPLRSALADLAASGFRAADYLSLRDKGSVRMAGLAGSSDVSTVPDPVLGIRALWSADDLRADFERLCGRFDLVRRDRILAVHVRRRSLGDTPVSLFASDMAALCKARDLTPVLIGLGTAHGDDRIARETCTTLDQHGVAAAALDRPEGLRDIAALLAHARVYAGSSLHGYIAAAAYGTPGVLVARPAYRKFDGLVEHLDRKPDLVPDWSAGLARVAAIADRTRQTLSPQLSGHLEDHWDRIAAAFHGGPDRKRADRLAFARLAFSMGMAQGGLDWATMPFTLAKDRLAARTGEGVHDTEPF